MRHLGSPRSASLISTALLSLLAAGCASTHRLPPDVVKAAKSVSADGTIRLEIDPDGEVERVVADVPLVDAPQVVKDAVERVRPGGRVLRCERLFQEEATEYAIVKRIGRRLPATTAPGAGASSRTLGARRPRSQATDCSRTSVRTGDAAELELANPAHSKYRTTSRDFCPPQ